MENSSLDDQLRDEKFQNDNYVSQENELLEDLESVVGETLNSTTQQLKSASDFDEVLPPSYESRDSASLNDGNYNVGDGILYCQQPESILNSPQPRIIQQSFDKINQLYEKYTAQIEEIERLEKTNLAITEDNTKAVSEKSKLAATIKDLEMRHSTEREQVRRQVMDYEFKLKALTDRNAAQEAHYLKTFAECQARHNQQLEALKKTTASAQREKDSAVIRYAQREKEVLDLKSVAEEASSRAKTLATERDALNSRLRAAKIEKENLVKSVDARIVEINELRHEVERSRAVAAEPDIRLSVANRRVQDLEEELAETKMEVEKISKKLREAREETETIRSNCKDIVRQYQENEELRSNSLEKKLMENEKETQMQQREHSDQEEIYKKLLDELDALKKQHKGTLLSLEEAKSGLSVSHDKCIALESRLASSEANLSTSMVEVSRLKGRIGELEQAAAELITVKQQLLEHEKAALGLESETADAKRDAASCQLKAEEMLALTQKLTDRNIALQSENSDLQSQISTLEHESSKQGSELKQAQSHISSLTIELHSLRTSTNNHIKELSDKLQERIVRESELQTQVEDEINRNRVLKKKHANNLKELKSELSTLRKRLESYENGTASLASIGSLGGGNRSGGTEEDLSGNHFGGRLQMSRNASVSSLETAPSVSAVAAFPRPSLMPSAAPTSASSPVSQSTETPSFAFTEGSAGLTTNGLTERHGGPASNSSDRPTGWLSAKHHGAKSNNAPDSGEVCVDDSDGITCQVTSTPNQAMIEKIVKLQRILVRRNDRIEFMEEHSRQLMEELRNKSRIIQAFAIKEDSEALVPEYVDFNKADMAKRGHSIMGAMFSKSSLSSRAVGSAAGDAHLTPAILLEINRKLQAVLEDSLLKTITYKDNLETLGKDISLLSQENRKLKLELQQEKKS